MKKSQNYLLLGSFLVGVILISACNRPESPTAPEGKLSYLAKASIQASTTDCLPVPSGLVSWWPGDGHANDIVGENHGTLQNGATFSTGFVTSGNGQGFSLDGVDDIIDVGSPQALDDLFNGIHDFTVSVWYVLEVEEVGRTSPYLTLFTKGNIGSCCDYSGTLSFAYDPYVRGYSFEIYDGGYGNGLVKKWSASDFPLNEWVHFALAYNAFLHDPEVYVNGQKLTGSYFYNQYDGTVIENILDQDFKIGGEFLTDSNVWPGNHYWKGLIDEFQVFDRILTEAEIRAEYNAGSAGKCKFISVEIDIKPGSDPNSINPRSKGVIPVAILTTEGFDATTVEPLSVEFGPDGASEFHGRGHINDVDGDGDDDLVLHFRTQETGIVAGDTEACLAGETTSGDPIKGCDTIRTVGR